MTDRAARWATLQVGRLGHSMNEVAVELGCDWHTVNTPVPHTATRSSTRTWTGFGEVHAVSFDETLFCRAGRWRTQ